MDGSESLPFPTEVSVDANQTCKLIQVNLRREFREYQQQLALSAQDAAQLSEMRYRGGAASYLEVLTNETNYFDAQLGLAQAQLNELAGLVRIYRNLGGGWQ